MATSSSSAVGGSVIDVQSLVSQLVAAERAPLDDQVKRETDKVTTQISALGTLKSALSTFQSTLASLATADKFETRTVTSGDDDVFTASATSSAASGSYSVEVIALAKAQQLASSPYLTGASAVIGTGTLTLGVAGLTFQVSIGSSNNTLAGIRDAINAAPDNSGVRASLINASDGARLVLTSSKTGALNTITVTESGGDGGLAAITYGAGNTSHYTEKSPAQDAEVEVAGYTVESATNELTGVIDGVTLSLKSASPGDIVDLTIAQDNKGAIDKIKAFVSAYNTLEATIVKLRGYDSTTQSGGPMLGDSLLSGLEQSLRRLVSDKVSGASASMDSLVSLGIKTQADGSLALDQGKLEKALAADPGAVTSLFTSSNGIATRLSAELKNRLADGAAIDARSDSLIAKQRTLTQKQSDIDARMEVIEARYLKQFTALDNLLSSLQTTSTYLSQQIDSLNSNND